MSGEIQRRATWPEKGLGEEKEGSEKQVANHGISKKKVGGRETRVTDGECLKPARESFGIERDRKRGRRVEIPVDRVGNEIEKDGRRERSQENRDCSGNVVMA